MSQQFQFVETQLRQMIKCSKEESTESLKALMELPELERKERLIGLIGDGFDTTRMIIAIKKLAEREEKDEPLRMEKKGKKTNVSKSKLFKVGSRPDRIKNRQICECMCTIHKLVGSCTFCGKVICEFEGEGQCPWCGQHPIEDNTSTPSFERAVARLDTLTKSDKDPYARTKVIDIAADFDLGNDSYNKWLDPIDRALAIKKVQDEEEFLEEQKKSRVITIDLQNNRVIVEKLKRVVKVVDVLDIGTPKKEESSTGLFRNPNLKTSRPVFKQPATKSKPKRANDDGRLSLSDYSKYRLQDEVQSINY